ncbi:hypothetical protein HY385_01200 [Candidatus Daviesbacteria bacterium]|nr:hypothetical protein [Candidatus Daviesbacteria bacterium]
MVTVNKEYNPFLKQKLIWDDEKEVVNRQRLPRWASVNTASLLLFLLGLTGTGITSAQMYRAEDKQFNGNVSMTRIAEKERGSLKIWASVGGIVAGGLLQLTELRQKKLIYD